LDFGAGYVLKSDAENELLPAITAALRGDQFLSSGLKATISSSNGAFGVCHSPRRASSSPAGPATGSGVEESLAFLTSAPTREAKT
jgi:hypothetical protein